MGLWVHLLIRLWVRARYCWESLQVNIDFIIEHRLTNDKGRKKAKNARMRSLTAEYAKKYAEEQRGKIKVIKLSFIM